MKELKIALFLFVCMAFLLVGCQHEHDTDPPKSNNPNEETVEDSGDDTQNTIEDTEVSDLSISIHGLADLDKMREMISCSDPEMLEQYLQSIEGGGAKSRKDLEQFVKLVDSIPYVSIAQGDITWICRSFGKSTDKEEPFDILYVSTEAENGEWTRIEYNLQASKVSEVIADQIAQMSASEVLLKPIQSKDKKLTVYAEKRKIQEAGNSIVWTVDIDGVLARIVYHTNDMDAVAADRIFSNSVVSNVKSLVAQ